MAYPLRKAMSFMPATLGCSDDLYKLPWNCLALDQDGAAGRLGALVLTGRC